MSWCWIWTGFKWGGGLFESDHFPASVHGTQFESNPAHISAVFNAASLWRPWSLVEANFWRSCVGIDWKNNALHESLASFSMWLQLLGQPIQTRGLLSVRQQSGRQHHTHSLHWKSSVQPEKLLVSWRFQLFLQLKISYLRSPRLLSSQSVYFGKRQTLLLLCLVWVIFYAQERQVEVAMVRYLPRVRWSSWAVGYPQSTGVCAFVFFAVCRR